LPQLHDVPAGARVEEPQPDTRFVLADDDGGVPVAGGFVLGEKSDHQLVSGGMVPSASRCRCGTPRVARSGRK
jgi:hypothetical protein